MTREDKLYFYGRMTDVVTNLNDQIHPTIREGNERERYNTVTLTCSVHLAGGSELEVGQSFGSRSPSPPPVLASSLPVLIPLQGIKRLIATLQLQEVTVVIRGWNVRARICPPKVQPDCVILSQMQGKGPGCLERGDFYKQRGMVGRVLVAI